MTSRLEAIRAQVDQALTTIQPEAIWTDISDLLAVVDLLFNDDSGDIDFIKFQANKILNDN